jgi:predicted nucleic acid-binding protein
MVAGLRSRNGASFQILAALPERRFTPLLSVPLVLEYEAVLKRDEHLSAHGISAARIDDFLHVWVSYAEPVRLNYLWRPQLRDNADEMVLETALNGRAEAIVTHNVKDFRAAAATFAVAIWRPADLLRALRQPS